MSARAWCYTINNYTLQEQLDVDSIECRYNIFGLEKGKEGTKHIQGYIEFSKVVRFSAIKKLLPRAHIEMRKGTRDQARDYCKKEGKFTEHGDWNAGGQGRRTDLDSIRELALTDGMRAVTAIGNAQQIKVAEKFLTYNEEGRDWKPEVEWIWGPTGTGKSKLAHEKLGEDTYRKSTGSKWWNGYDNHSNVIIDDFRDSWMPLTEMLSLLDRYEHRVECKGGERQFRPKKIIVTSAKRPEDCYKGCGEDIQQLIRRIDTVTELSNDVKGVILEPFAIDDFEKLLEEL